MTLITLWFRRVRKIWTGPGSVGVRKNDALVETEEHRAARTHNQIAGDGGELDGGKEVGGRVVELDGNAMEIVERPEYALNSIGSRYRNGLKKAFRRSGCSARWAPGGDARSAKN